MVSAVSVALAMAASALGAVPGIAVAQAGSPFVETSLSPGTRVVVGQPVTLSILVATPDFFRSAPRFAEIDIPNAITTPPGRTQNSTERRGGTAFAAQTVPYRITPQLPGEYEIPSIEVTFNSGPSATPVTLRTQPITFEAVIPEEARDLPYFIGTSRLTGSQSVEPLQDTILVGQSVTRTVTVTVTEALSIVIPPLPQDSVEGLALYVDPPRVEDVGGERGETRRGSRTERRTYVAREVGDYELPGVEIAWWNTRTGTLERTTLPAVTFRVEADPAAAPTFEAEVDADSAFLASTSTPERDLPIRELVWLLATGALLSVVVWAARRFGPPIRRRLEDAREARRNSEARRFRDLLRACKRNDPTAALNGLIAWAEALRSHSAESPPRAGPATTPTMRPPLIWLRDSARTEALPAELAELQASLYGPAPVEVQEKGARWSGAALARTLREERTRRHAGDRGLGRTSGPGTALEPLNPQTS